MWESSASNIMTLITGPSHLLSSQLGLAFLHLNLGSFPYLLGNSGQASCISLSFTFVI